tara:strand:+ start:1440 stop:1955 length:516 start_codon:yes stop_codon:yes gene_type:complete
MILNKIKIFLTDIDGVWTDGGMYYDENGNEYKKFNTYDSAGVLYCHLIGIKTGIVTGESSNAVLLRAKKLGINYCYTGVDDKVSVISNLLSKLSFKWSEVAYIGDDINDIKVLKKVGLSACPSSAPNYIKDIVDLVIDLKGGEGCFRSFVEYYLKENEKLDFAINEYLKNI